MPCIRPCFLLRDLCETCSNFALLFFLCPLSFQCLFSYLFFLLSLTNEYGAIFSPTSPIGTTQKLRGNLKKNSLTTTLQSARKSFSPRQKKRRKKKNNKIRHRVMFLPKLVREYFTEVCFSFVCKGGGRSGGRR